MKTLPRRFVLLIGLVLLTGPFGFAQSETPEELKKLRQLYDQQFALANRDVIALDEKYLAALNRLLSAETQAGNLEVVLAAKQEIEAHGDGSGYDPASFQKRLSNHPALKKLQMTYQEARAKMDAASGGKVSALTTAYDGKLAELVTTLTKSGRINDALAVKTERERIAGLLAAAAATKTAGNESTGADDPATSEDEKEPIRARFYCTAKAEAEVYLNGDEIRLRSDNAGGGTNGKSSFLHIKEGDAVVVRAISKFAFRSVALALELPYEKRVIFFKPSDYRVMGQGARVDPKRIDAAAIQKAPEKHPQPIIPDDYWTKKWTAHDLGEEIAIFSRPDPQGDWAIWGAILTKEMIEREN